MGAYFRHRGHKSKASCRATGCTDLCGWWFRKWVGALGREVYEKPLVDTKAAAESAGRALLDRIERTGSPEAEAPKPTPGPATKLPTVRDGVEAHLANMRKRGRAKASIDKFERDTTNHLAAWLDRPFAELNGAALNTLHDSIKRRSRSTTGANPANAKGAVIANQVILHVSAAWNALNAKLEGQLGGWNPAKAVVRDTIKPKRERLDDLPDYAARVATMRNPIQRDGLMFALYTGLRCEDVRTLRLEHVDFKAHTLRVPDPKGGEAMAFTIPLSSTPLAILKRRRASNAADLGRADTLRADAGFAFPAINSDGEPGPIGDLRQRTHDGDQHGRFPVEDVHTLRRTWQSIAHEEGVSELDQHVLSNHSFGSHNVNETYIVQHIDHLARCAATIDVGITKRLKAKSKRAAER